LAIKAVDLARDAWALRQQVLPPANGEQPVASAAGLLKPLDSPSPLAMQIAVRRRVRDALRFVVRQGSAEGLDEHLRSLAENDQVRTAASYALPRFMIWAIPAVGSLGTVVGIAAAVSQLGVLAADDPFTGVTAGLALAFDTTALSLGLAIVLVLLRFVCEQQESQLLTRVDEQARQELLGKFAVAPASRGGGAAQVEQLRQLTESLVQATTQLARRPAGAAEAGGGQFGAASGEQLAAIVASAVAKTLQAHLPSGVSAAAAGAPVGWTEMQQALQQNSEFIAQQQAEMAQQSKIIAQLTDMLGKDSKNWPVRKRMRADQDKPESSSLAGLWNAMNE
jgi:biopolymer transport protein ExbB/TolQ